MDSKEKSGNGRRKIVWLVVFVVCIIVASFVALRFAVIPGLQYQKAHSLVESGNETEAYDVFMALGDYKDAPDKARALLFVQQMEALQASKVGEQVEFGAYEQDNDLKNGAEPIVWNVIAKVTDKALLLSDAILDAKPYHNDKQDVTWADSAIRAWLNETFLQEAFTEAEQEKIFRSVIPAETNPDYSTNPGPVTEDKVFLLSNNEALHYLDSRVLLSAAPTKFALANKAYFNGKNGNGYWWLRTPGQTQNMAIYVYYHGYIESAGYDVTGNFIGVRPAIWVDLVSQES